jgi:hypothetical protein
MNLFIENIDIAILGTCMSFTIFGLLVLVTTKDQRNKNISVKIKGEWVEL